VLLVALDRPQDAEPLLAELYAALPKAALPPARAALFVADYGCVLARLHKDAEAEPVLRDAHRRLMESNQSKHPKLREVIESVAGVCERSGQSEQAARWRAQLGAAAAATTTSAAP
jgi:hypothetical protein